MWTSRRSLAVTALVVDADEAALTRTIVRARASLIPSPRAARGHRGLLLDAGLREVTTEAHTTVLTGPGTLPLLTGLAQSACAAGAITRDQAGRGAPTGANAPAPTGPSLPCLCSWRPERWGERADRDER